MRKVLVLLLSLLISSQAYAVEKSKVQIQASIDDETSTLSNTGLITKYFNTGARQQQSVSLTASAFTGITIPTGAKAILIDVISADGIKLKGVTGDTGISLDSTVPVLLPISGDGSATIGIQNMETSAQTIRVFFF